MSFAFALPGQSIEQKLISSKQSEIILGKAGNNINKVDTLLANIGHVTKKQFVSGLASVGGEMGPLHMYSAMIGASQRGAPDWINKHHKDNILPQIDTLMDMNFNWKRLDGDAGRKRFEDLHELLETPKANRDALWDQYNKQADQTTFLTERKELQEAGFAKHEHIRDLFEDARKRGAGTASDSLDAALRNSMKEVKNGMSHKEVADIFMRNVGTQSSIQREASAAVLASDRILAESMMQKATRGLRGWDKARQAIGHITPMKVGGIVGAGLVAMTALNLLGGDGTPEDPNDLPSVNNPSFSHQRGGQMAERRTLNSPVSSNMSMGLITGSHERMDDSLQSASAMLLGGRHNTVSVRSDGSNPYSADMFKYSN
jgi:hypothetical protein